MDGDFLGAGRGLGHGGARRELLAQFLGHLFILQAVHLQPDDHGDVLALVPLDTLDLDLGGGFALGIAGLVLCGLGFLLGGIFRGPFLDGDFKGGQVGTQGLWTGLSARGWDMNGCRESTFGVEPIPQIGLVLLQPLLTFLRGATELAELSLRMVG